MVLSNDLLKACFGASLYKVYNVVNVDQFHYVIDDFIIFSC